MPKKDTRGTHGVDLIPIENTMLDRRRKLTLAQEDEIREAKYTMSTIMAAGVFGVSRRTIQFIWHPERLERNRELRAQRVQNGAEYWTREQHRESIASLRAYKRDLLEMGLVNQPTKEPTT